MDGLNKVIDQFFSQKMRDGVFAQLGSEGGDHGGRTRSSSDAIGTVAGPRDTAAGGEHTAADDSERSGSTVAGASFNFVNSVVGAGIIGIPFAMQQCGFILGICLLSLVAILIYFSVMMLVECGIKANRLDFEELSEHLLGWPGYYAALTFMFLFAYGAQVAYLVVVGDTVPVVAALFWPGSVLTNRRAVIGLTATLVVLPLCLLKDLSTLAWTSLLSIAADAAFVLIVVVFAPAAAAEQGIEHHRVSVVNSALFVGLGTMSFAFVCQHNSFIVFKSLRKPTLGNWHKVASASLGVSFVLCLILGVAGYLAFMETTQGDILNNFPPTGAAVNAGRALLAVTMILTYPMECFVTRHCVLSVVDRVLADRARAQRHRVVDEHEHEQGTELTPYPPAAHAPAPGPGRPAAASSSSSSVSAVDVEGEGIEGEGDDGLIRESGDDSAVPHKRDVNGGAKPNNAFKAPRRLDRGHDGSDSDNSRSRSNSHSVGGDSASEWGDVYLGDASSEAAGGGLPPPGGAARPYKSCQQTPEHPPDGTTRVPAPPLPLPPPDVDTAQGAARRATATLLLWGSSLGLALAFDDLGVVLALTGAVAASMLGYVLPAVFYCKTYAVDLARAADAVGLGRFVGAGRGAGDGGVAVPVAAGGVGRWRGPWQGRGKKGRGLADAVDRGYVDDDEEEGDAGVGEEDSRHHIRPPQRPSTTSATAKGNGGDAKDNDGDVPMDDSYLAEPSFYSLSTGSTPSSHGFQDHDDEDNPATIAAAVAAESAAASGAAALPFWARCRAVARFTVPLFMVVFGFVSLIVGVVSVFMQQSSRR